MPTRFVRSEVIQAGLVFIKVGSKVHCYCQINPVTIDFWLEEKLDVNFIESLFDLVKLKSQILTRVFMLYRTIASLVLIVHRIVKHFEVKV